MSDLGPVLRQLAQELGVATEFWDWQGRHAPVSPEAVVAVLRGLGVEAGSEDDARAALEAQRLAPWRRMLPPVLVTREGRRPTVPVHVRHGDPVEVWVELEDGGRPRRPRQVDRWVDPQWVDGQLTGEATFEIPGDLPLGWHVLRARSGEQEAWATLVVTPTWVGLPARRTWGLMAQLYSVRSARSWGVGDLGDLADLAAWSGHQLGAGFVLVNPLHASAPVPPLEPSPYLPVTRRFANPIYLRVEGVPEYAWLGPEQRAQVDALGTGVRRGGDAGGLLDRDEVWEAKRAALEILYRTPRSPARQAAFDAYRDREGGGLLGFATWCALTEVHGPDWHRWPAPLRDAQGPAVARAREELADRVTFFAWLQWQLDQQLTLAQATAHAAGMPVGIVHDLAVGVHRNGSDTWALADVMASGITVGAPPDAFNQQGQDWNQPPWRPDRLAQTGYVPYRDMLRTVLRHAGGLRVDHVIGLFRLWWVPDGMPPDQGTYVRYDHEALVGILALEAVRAGAFVVGEDLGTVEPWVRDYLRERGIAGTSILWFEYDGDRGPLAPERWRELCLATATTHDLPPTAGYLRGEHIRIRDELGLLTRPVEEERAVDVAERQAVLGRLRERGLVSPTETRRSAGADGGRVSDDDDMGDDVVVALHRYLAAAPSQLLGVALADMAGERRAQNQPGTDREYPNWRVPLADGTGQPVLLEDLAGRDLPRRLAEAVGDGGDGVAPDD